MKKKSIVTGILLLMLAQSVHCETYDDFSNNAYVKAGLQYYKDGRYTSSIEEFKRALRQNPANHSARSGIINSYIMRAQYYNNTANNAQGAISDLKSAIFYFKYFNPTRGQNTSQAHQSAISNLATLERETGSDVSETGRINSARKSRAKGEFAAAAYDYEMLTNSAKYKVEALTGCGDIMQILAMPQNAVGYYERAAALAPSNAELGLKLAGAYEKTGSYDKAVSKYNTTLQTSEEKEDIMNSLERICRQKAEQNPSDSGAHCNLGAVYQKRGNYEAALREYNTAIRLNPSDMQARLNLGLLYFEQGNYKLANETYNSVLQSEPKNTTARLQKAKCLAKMNAPGKAIDEYKSILAYDGTNTEAQTELFDLTTKIYGAQTATEELAKLPGAANNAEIQNKLAYSLHSKGNTDEALKYYSKALALNPGDVSIYLNMAQIYSDKGNTAQAQNLLNTAKTRFPGDNRISAMLKNINEKNIAAKYAEAENFVAQKDYAGAIRAYSSINPPTLDSLTGLAGVYSETGNNFQAIEAYKKALVLAPENTDIALAICGLYLNEDKYAEAQTFLQKVLQKKPNDPKAKEFKDYIAQMNSNSKLTEAANAYEAKQYAKAEKLLTEIINGGTKDASAYYYRASIYENSGKAAQAVTDYEKAAMYDSSNPTVYYSLAVNYDELKNTQKTISNFKKYLSMTKEENEYTNYAKDRLKALGAN